MNLANLVDRIQAAGHGVKAKSLFMQMMPAEAQSAILLRGMLAGTKIDHYLPGFYQTEFQVIVRSIGYVTGEALIKRVTADLTFEELVLGNQCFNYCRPRTLPVAFPLSAGNLVEHSVMFDVCFVET